MSLHFRLITTVDCKDWNIQIDLASHEIGLPVPKSENKDLEFQVNISLSNRVSLYIK